MWENVNHFWDNLSNRDMLIVEMEVVKMAPRISNKSELMESNLVLMLVLRLSNFDIKRDSVELSLISTISLMLSIRLSKDSLLLSTATSLPKNFESIVTVESSISLR